jgi:hypothetical protein
MKLSLKISLISGGLNGFISAILGLSKEVEDDGGVDKDSEYSFDFYTKFSGEVLVSSMTQIKEGYIYAYEL